MITRICYCLLSGLDARSLLGNAGHQDGALITDGLWRCMNEVAGNQKHYLL